MCGIAGFLHHDPNRPADAAVVKRMTDAVIHRGPDGEGFHVTGPLALGHRRLAIIDLAGGDQPMASADASLTLIFNGEIYNYLELREELEALGHAFRTQSDTEVLLAAYRQWGVDCQEHLNGMWAFALWDDSARRLFLSRDRLGEKPLHFAEHEGSFYFASEMKSLFAAGVPREFDSQWLEVFTCLGYLPAPHSFFHGVRKLLPGHCLVVENGRISERKYWDLPLVDEGDMERNAATVRARFEELLADSVRIRMRSDVPYGAFLSGGLDSSSIVALMADVSSHPVNTFTIGFRQPEYDERELAQNVADAFATNHRAIEVEPESFDASLERILHHYDEPFGDSSAIPTGIVSRHARRHVKMVLTGDGGDEVLSGYTMYQGEKFAERFRRLPAVLREPIPAVAGAMARGLRGQARYRMNRARNVAHASNLDFDARFLQKLSWVDPARVKALLRNHTDVAPVVSIEDFMRERLKKCPYADGFYRLMYYHLKVSLPDDMLVKVDRMSMAESLEVRPPFLDHRLVEYMVGVHKDVKMDGLTRKAVLRDTVARRLPPSLLQAPKRGFGVPLGDWFRGDSFDRYARTLLDANATHGLDTDVVGDVLARNEARKENVGNFLWILVVLARHLGEQA